MSKLPFKVLNVKHNKCQTSWISSLKENIFFIFLKFLFLSFAYKKVDSFFYKIAFPEIKKLYCQIFFYLWWKIVFETFA